LSTEAQSLAVALAIWEEAVPRDWVEAVAQGGANAWGELDASGLATESAEHLWSLQPPALGRVLQSRLAADEQAMLHGRAADWLARHRPEAAGARFHHLLAAGRNDDALAQADAAVRGAAPEEAAAIADAAAQAAEGTDPGLAAEWWAKAGGAHLALGHNVETV